MSAGSFDDSSNLVDVTTQSNGEQKQDTATVNPERKENQADLLNEPVDFEEGKESETKSKSKKSKAKKLFKRAKSPISGAINKTTKEFKKLSNLPKHHYSIPKSPQKSPSKENLTEEYKHLEDKLSEKSKASEEWLAFQQMQDRIKQTVLKTQTSLNKYSSHSEDEDQKTTSWTAFDEETEEIIDTTLRTGPAINVSCANDVTEVLDNNLLDLNESKPKPSTPPATPEPPSNSRISSMDNLIQETGKTDDGNKPENTEQIDLLGLNDPSCFVSDVPVTSNILAQDMVGLDSFLEPIPVGEISEKLADKEGDLEDNTLTGYTFTASIPNESSLFKSATDPVTTDYNDILIFEQPIHVDQHIKPTLEQKSDTISQISEAVDLIPDNKETEKSVLHLESANVETPSIEPLPALKPVSGVLDPVKTIPGKDDIGLQNVLAPDTFDTFNEKKEQTNSADTTLVFDDLASFDPMKAPEVQEILSTELQGNMNPFQQLPGSQQHGIQSQSQGQSFGAVPIEQDILSKIRKMSTPNQPISPARKLITKPADPFGFVKKELGAGEDDGSYKSMADLQRAKQEDQNENDVVEDIQDQSLKNLNNPFLSGDFDDDYSNKELSENAAAVFGIDKDTLNFDTQTPPSSNLDVFLGGAEEVKSKPVWTDVVKGEDTNDMWADSDFSDNTRATHAFEGKDSNQSQVSGDAWGSGQMVSNEAITERTINPFQQDDFSTLDKIPFEMPKDDLQSPFHSGEINLQPSIVTSSVNNPFLNLEDQATSSDTAKDLLESKPVMLSDSESFFFDSVNDSQQAVDGTGDIFDPFKVTKEEISDTGTKLDDTADPLDIFSAVAASGDKQLAKPSDDDHGFVLEIKPATSDTSDKSSSVIAPLLKPPPKPPKSPQPPRENPFDRDSPPEENFAQFEVREVEKPKEPIPKSISTDSTTTEEEPEQPLEPLEPFLPKLEKEGFKLMLRYPTKKKIAGNRYWKNVFVRIQKQSEGPMVKVYSDANDALPMQELLLQACYSLSETCLQQYDQYGKIHAVKLQYVFYKERVGIKTERIAPSIVKFKKREKPKATMILDHSPQVSELLKFGSLDKAEIILFMQAVEDALMNLDAHREKTLTYTKDEITAEVRDEYVAELDKFGKVLSQKARVRIFVLAFLTGMPTVEVGLNDKRRRGKEVVGRCDIIPIKTEEWIKLEDVEFHNCVDKEEFEKTNNIKFHPLDACQFELLRYRVRLRENKELPLQLTIQQIFKERKCEIRCDLLVTGYHSYSKKHGQFPCEDIEVRFPIPEQWIYMFRYERRFGYGSIHSSLRKPGKIKGKAISFLALLLSKTTSRYCH